MIELINGVLESKELVEKMQNLALQIEGNGRRVLMLVHQIPGDLVDDNEEIVYCQIYAGNIDNTGYLMTEFIIDDLVELKKRMVEQLFFVESIELIESGRINDDVLKVVQEVIEIAEERKTQGYEIEDRYARLVTNAVNVKYESECFNATVYSECVKCCGELEVLHYDGFYPSITAVCKKCEQLYNVVPGKRIP